MNVSRRSFLIGGASFATLAGCKAFHAAPGEFGNSNPLLTLGVVSDIHCDAAIGDFMKFGDTVQFEKTLRWFDRQGVDGVIVAGDMADNGMVNQLQCVADAWFRVFPDGKAADGRRVEQLFVYGNHDYEGWCYDKFDVRYHDRKSFESARICRDEKKVWEQIFHEPYSPIWKKEVKGYSIIGAHWVFGGNSWSGVPAVEPYFAEHGKELDPSRPFFFTQHCHPKDTVYGDEAWGSDAGYATRALSPFSNAVAFSGHSHITLTDERSIWQGAFTSLGTSSLRYGGGGVANKWKVRQGMLVKVYADHIVYCRRDFINDLPLGDDWIMPLPVAESKPFAFAERARKFIAPQFAANARLGVERKNKKGWLLTIPCANSAAGRVFRYEIVADIPDKNGKKFVKRIFEASCNLPRSMAGKATRHLVKFDAFAPDAKPSFTVTPLDSFANRGKSIKA